ncbi:pyruvate oxidase [Sesbania bispinosa]|nr:pyruvate oxidase [Sesbania bispinosa]
MACHLRSNGEEEEDMRCHGRSSFYRRKKKTCAAIGEARSTVENTQRRRNATSAAVGEARPIFGDTFHQRRRPMLPSEKLILPPETREEEELQLLPPSENLVSSPETRSIKEEGLCCHRRSSFYRRQRSSSNCWRHVPSKKKTLCCHRSSSFYCRKHAKKKNCNLCCRWRSSSSETRSIKIVKDQI